MSSELDFPARGKVTAVHGGALTFLPAGTNYELQLQTEAPFTGPLNTPLEGLIHVQARKVWTVPSGGNFITPIVGPPKIIQGRVRHLTDDLLVIQAGTNFVVELPESDSAFDLTNGLVAVGRMVNVTVLPGARFAMLAKAAAS